MRRTFLVAAACALAVAAILIHATAPGERAADGVAPGADAAPAPAVSGPTRPARLAHRRSLATTGPGRRARLTFSSRPLRLREPGSEVEEVEPAAPRAAAAP